MPRTAAETVKYGARDVLMADDFLDAVLLGICPGCFGGSGRPPCCWLKS